MTDREFLDALLAAHNLEEVKAALEDYQRDTGAELTPFGRLENNRGTIEVAGDPARSAIERVTNAHDALLELEHRLHEGKPECRSPREAAEAWLDVPEKGGLSKLSTKQRQDLAAKTVLRLEPGEGWQSRIVTVIDSGIGIGPNEMEGTILSLNQSNKIRKHYLAGTYGQGGASTLAFSQYALIASRLYRSDDIAFTVAWYDDRDPDEFKTGHYVYLTKRGKLPVVKATPSDQKHGTTIRHFGYDLTKYNSAIGPKSLYGALQRLMFNPVAAVRYENTVAKPTSNRTIKGSRNALNGAVDQGDEASKGPDLDHYIPNFSVSLGDLGSISIEYWALSLQKAKSGKIQKPSRGYVDDAKPIILTHNGQNQDEMSGRFIRKEANLPYLQTQGRLIVHVSCDCLSTEAKRKFFSSTRESSKEGFVKNVIQEEIVNLLKSDDELRRLNDIAKEQSRKDKDDAAGKQIQRQVARLLRLVGSDFVEMPSANSDGGGESGGGGKPSPKPLDPISLKEPPTYVKIVAREDKPISFFPGQRRYIRIETDANSTYHDPDNPKGSKINIVVGDDLEVFGTSPLRGGRMRAGIKAKTEIALDAKGSIRIELYRPGASTLSDEKDFVIVKPPKSNEGGKKTAFPKFELIPVDGPSDENWVYAKGDSNSGDDVRQHANGAQMDNGVLWVYYSTQFPRFASERKKLEQKNPESAQSFETRYKLWLAVHALLKHEEDEAAEGNASEDEEMVAEMSRQERCRLATIAAMMAAQEVNNGVNLEDEDAA